MLDLVVVHELGRLAAFDLPPGACGRPDQEPRRCAEPQGSHSPTTAVVTPTRLTDASSQAGTSWNSGCLPLVRSKVECGDNQAYRASRIKYKTAPTRVIWSETMSGLFLKRRLAAGLLHLHLQLELSRMEGCAISETLSHALRRGKVDVRVGGLHVQVSCTCAHYLCPCLCLALFVLTCGDLHFFPSALHTPPSSRLSRQAPCVGGHRHRLGFLTCSCSQPPPAYKKTERFEGCCPPLQGNVCCCACVVSALVCRRHTLF